MTPGIPDFSTDEIGLLLYVDGMNLAMRWDGLTAAPVTAGLAAPATAVTLAGSGSGTISGSYYAFLRYVDAQNNFSDASPQSTILTIPTASPVGTITFSGLEVPSNPRVVRRQILRNTAGQASVFYIDLDTTNLTSTSLTSTKTDTLLSAGTAVPLFDTQNLPFMNSHGVPPNWKTCIAAHRDRMFMAADFIYRDGSVTVTNGSTSVRGVGTAWTTSFATRFLWVDGASQSYEIASVDATNQIITLLTAYADATNPYARYGIRPAPAESRLVYFSGPGEAESWPAFNSLSLPADGDEITGVMPMSSWVFLFERRHAYRVTYKDSPILDGAVFLAVNRGAVNNRCWVIIEDAAYVMDEAGCYKFDGSSVLPISGTIQDMWESENWQPGDLRIQWAARRYFHCVYYPAQEVVRWFVTLSGTGLPRHALCFELRRGGWWIEEFAAPVGASTLGRLQGEPKVLIGGPAGQVFCYGAGTLDQADAALGTTRGAVTSAGPLSLVDGDAVFHSSFVGSPITLTGGRGEGQTRIVTSLTSTTLRIDRPWAAVPDTTTTYQVGGIPWQYRCGWLRWMEDEQLHPRRLEIAFRPLMHPATLSARILTDRSLVPDKWQAYYGSEYNQFASSPGSPDLVADLTKPSGFVQRRLDGRRDFYLDGPTFAAIELAGASNQDQVVVIAMTLDGSRK